MKGALRKFVANCAPNLRKIAVISFRASEKGCAKLSQICREFEKVNFGQFCANTPFPTLPLAITAFGGPEGYFSLAIIAFGAFQFIVPKYYCRLEKMELKESRLLI